MWVLKLRSGDTYIVSDAAADYISEAPKGQFISLDQYGIRIKPGEIVSLKNQQHQKQSFVYKAVCEKCHARFDLNGPVHRCEPSEATFTAYDSTCGCVRCEAASYTRVD